MRTVGGPWTVDFIRRLNFDAAFVSGAGLTLESGLTTSRGTIADVLGAARDNAACTIGLVDATKFGRASLVSVAAASDLDLIVTDGALSERVALEFRDAGVVTRRSPALSPTWPQRRNRRRTFASGRPASNPSLPGFMTFIGSSACLICVSVPWAGPHWRARYGDSVTPTPWWSLITPPRVEDRLDPGLPDLVIQGERVGQDGCIGDHEPRVHHRAPFVPVAEVGPQAQAVLGKRRQGIADAVVHVEDAVVARDGVDRSPHRRELRVASGLVGVVAVLPPRPAHVRFARRAAGRHERPERGLGLGVGDARDRPRTSAARWGRRSCVRRSRTGWLRRPPRRRA